MLLLPQTYTRSTMSMSIHVLYVYPQGQSLFSFLFFFRAKVFYLNESPLISAFNFFYIGNLSVTKKSQF